MHSAERVVDEMESVLDAFPGTGHLMLWDDLFVADRNRLRQIVELAERRGIPSRATIGCTVRANLVDEELCSLLKRLNAASVAFGAESGSDRILKILKAGVDVATNQQALDLLAAHDMPGTCSFIVGTPGETAEDVRATYDFILRNTAADKLAFYDVNVLAPMPGSEVWTEAEHRGIVGPEMNWNRLRYFASRQTNAGALEQWATLRRENQSIYLNGDILPEERLVELMAEYEARADLARDRRRTLSGPTEGRAAPSTEGSWGPPRQEGRDGELAYRIAELERALSETRQGLREREAQLAAAYNLLDGVARGKVMRLMNGWHSLKKRLRGG